MCHVSPLPSSAPRPLQPVLPCLPACRGRPPRSCPAPPGPLRSGPRADPVPQPRPRQPLQPDVNASVVEFTAIGDDVCFVLRSVRNVGDNVIEAIVQARKKSGGFSTFADFLDKAEVAALDKRAVDSPSRPAPLTHSATRATCPHRCHGQPRRQLRRPETWWQRSPGAAVDEHLDDRGEHRLIIDVRDSTVLRPQPSRRQQRPWDLPQPVRNDPAPTPTPHAQRNSQPTM